ncbi:hypothetical protein [Dyadobacter sp. 50-39]|uniref:hypothetical protein n=1 Tax=Dyadobacter sp. 50-39 TaxID=1895756 RepID=UPI00095F56FF|nr:hypothetical protein [Dyadobacter sp. 50-39]OJV22430.1 MAG: hypothetical protein BGO21_30195 [Dyadobacter sp. 50-39]
MLWRLHIRPDPKNGKTHDDVVSYCTENHVAGIGWPVAGNILTPSDYERAARSKYGVRVASIPFAYNPVIGEYIWARDKNGKYYLGRIRGNWFYSNDPLHLELDIPNQRACEWVRIGNEENVPGKIVACFRPAKTFQAIRDPQMEEFSKWAFSRVPSSNFLTEWLKEQRIDKKTFFNFIKADDCEDIVGLYLQKVKGYCLIPSSCKKATIGHEFILKHSITSQTAVAQVKQGGVELDERLRGNANHVFLFSTEGVVTSDSNDITVLTADELFDFVCQNKNLLPSRMDYWLHLLS